MLCYKWVNGAHLSCYNRRRMTSPVRSISYTQVFPQQVHSVFYVTYNTVRQGKQFPSKSGIILVTILTVSSRRPYCLWRNRLSRVTEPCCCGLHVFWSTIRLRWGTRSRWLTRIFQRLPFFCMHLGNWGEKPDYETSGVFLRFESQGYWIIFGESLLFKIQNYNYPILFSVTQNINFFS